MSHTHPKRPEDLIALVDRALSLPASEWKSSDWGRFGALCMEAVCGQWDELLDWMDGFERRLVTYWDHFVASRPEPTLVEELLNEGVSAWLEVFDILRVMAQAGGKPGPKEMGIAREGQCLMTMVRLLLTQDAQQAKAA